MTDPRLDFIERLQAATNERLQRVQQVADGVSAIRGEATSPDRLVTVKVAPNGALLELELDDEALELGAPALGALVVATARTATERAAAAVAGLVEPLDQPLDVAGAPSGGRHATGGADGPPGLDGRFDDALRRADAVADAIEDRLRTNDPGPG